ncbi:MAG: thioredoxin family protein, partial [Ktedonobacterales bacterium]
MTPSDTLIRLGGVALLRLLTYSVVLVARRLIARRGQRVLDAAPLMGGAFGATSGGPRVRILAFGSEDCVQCHRLQHPVLQRILAEREGVVGVIDVHAPTSPELTRRYNVLTLPTTVVLDEMGRARA